ncbi:hypothetical protein [Roseiterribacter gracilis]|uniref:hypothetical protein n=1 Tax=Roseiterribacter gracilis TaxID=2812848 RepID=UPI003B439144
MSPRAPLRLVALSSLVALTSCTQPANGSGATGAPASSSQLRVAQADTARAVTPPSQTEIGAKAAELRAQATDVQTQVRTQRAALEAARGQALTDQAAYQAATASIVSRLQVGTPKGNPRLVAAAADATARLDAVEGDQTRVRALADDVRRTGERAAAILGETRRTLTLSGAVEEDHALLHEVEDETNGLVVQLARLNREVDADVARQTQLIGVERKRLAALQVSIQRGELVPGAAVTSSAAAAPAAERTAAATPAPEKKTERPLVVIRFDRPDVAYGPQLTTVTKEALTRVPGAKFQVDAVAPRKKGEATDKARAAAQKEIDGVVKVLVDAGVARDRITTGTRSSGTATGPEVHIYVR